MVQKRRKRKSELAVEKKDYEKADLITTLGTVYFIYKQFMYQKKSEDGS